MVLSRWLLLVTSSVAALLAVPVSTRLAAQGTEPVEVTTQGGSQPAPSRDGEWIAFRSGGMIAKIRPDGTEPTLLVAGTIPVRRLLPAAVHRERDHPRDDARMDGLERLDGALRPSRVVARGGRDRSLGARAHAGALPVRASRTRGLRMLGHAGCDMVARRPVDRLRHTGHLQGATCGRRARAGRGRPT